MFLRLFALVLAFMGGAQFDPAASDSTCVCIDLGRPPPRVVFQGRVLGVAPDSAFSRVTFVVEASWRGASGDTVQVVNPYVGNCSAAFFVGHSYLVRADVAQGRPTLPACGDDGHRTNSARAELLMSRLGAPERTHLPGEETRLETLRSGSGEPPPVGSPRRALSLMVVDEHDQGLEGVRVDLLGAEPVVTGAGGGAFITAVPEGLHLARLTLRDGSSVVRYALVRCAPSWNVEGPECVGQSRQFFVVDGM